MNLELFLSLFIQYGYWIVFAGILLDNAGLPLPGELLLLTFGALARTGDLDLGLGVLVATAAAMSGDSVSYWLGRLGGERLLRTYCRVTLGSGKCLQKAVAFYQLRGKVAVVFGRFVIGVRAFLFPLAGSARMPYVQFLLFDSIGALVWAGLFILVGYGLGWQVEGVSEGYRAASMGLAAMLGVGFAGYLLMKLYRRWRHGPGSPRERLIARVTKALRLAVNGNGGRSQMFGWGKVTCVLCNVQVPRKQALRSSDRKDVAVCDACYERWYRDGRTCVACQALVRVAQEVGVFLDRRAFGHADCGSVRLRGR